MLTIAYYFLQVVLCSGMLMGYYLLVLRNKRFHQYNRFYLLAAAVLSWIVPLIKISWNKPIFENEAPPMMNILSVVADNNSQIEATITKRGVWNWDLLASGIYFAIAAFLLIAMIRAFVRLYRLMKHHSCKNVGEVFLILTHAKGTPFSFFRYIFWNEEIDIRSEAGQQILKHELTHVQQKHSFDKLFIQVMLIGGWFNPFFWLLRREMEMIHEFIADKKAVNNGDTAALAQMLLTAAYPQQKFALTHPFFFSPIKRRLLMLTNNKNPRFSYIRRLVVLPLLAIVIVLFAFRSKEQRENGELSVASVVENYKEEIADVFLTDDAQNVSPDSLFINGRKFAAETINIKDLAYYPSILALTDEKQITNEENHVTLPSIGSVPVADPLIVVNGQRYTRAQLETLDPVMIQSVAVEKGEAALEKYGSDALQGVLSITLKPSYTKPAFAAVAKDDERFSFPALTGVAKDDYHNLVKNRKIIIKEIIYQGEEKVKVYEEVHEAISDNEGTFSVKIGTGTPSSSSKSMNDIDLSKGPFYVNIKTALPPTVKATWWVASNSYIDLGFSQLTIKDNRPNKPETPIVYSGNNRPTGSTNLITLPNGDVIWRDVTITGFNSLAPNNFNVTAEVKTSITPINKEIADNTTRKEETANQTTEKENVLNEVTVISYGSGNDKEKIQGGATPARFPGGQAAWEKYLMRNLDRDIPKKNKGPFGKYTVVVSFIVDKDGGISDVRAVNDPGFGTRAEAERVIIKGPKWVPATDVKGQAIAYRNKQNISFIYVDEKTVALTNLQIADAKPGRQVEAGKGTLSARSVPLAGVGGTITGGTFSGTARTIEGSGVTNVTIGTITGGTFSGTLSSGTGSSVNDSRGTISAVSAVPPSFPGGLAAWTKYLERNANTEALVAKGAPPGTYTVIVGFAVGLDGTVSDIHGQNDPGYGAMENAERLFKKGPKWVPGRIEGTNTPLAMRHSMTIRFVVKDSKVGITKETPYRVPYVVANNVVAQAFKGKNVTIDSNSTAVAVIDIPSVKKGDPILVTPQKDNTDWAVYSAWVSAENQVSVRFANYTKNPVKVASDDYKIVVIK